MVEMRTPLDASASPLSSLGLYTPRFAGPIVGRTRELAAIEQELVSAERGLACLTLEGEPGIGKTRLLLALEEQTRKRGFLPIAVTADEELRGPFLLARSILSCPTVMAAQPADVQQAVTKARDALADGDDPGLENLPPDQKLVRIFDLAALALRLLARERPVALLVDDLQWADSDSLRMLRYVTRVDTSSPILLALTLRPSEVAFVHEAVTLLADLERIGLVRRLTVGRFNQIQSSEFLHQVLGATIDPTSAATMHSQAEGVPFVLVEQTHAYRASGLLQQVGGTWRLAPNADRLLPAAVRTLIGRRAAHLPEETNAALAEGGILGRRFSLRDLVDLRAHLGDARTSSEELARALEPAIAAGLLVEQPPDSPADYSFSHDQIRQHVVAGLEASRRRTIHGAIVDMLAGDTREPSTECLALLAEHAQAAGRNDLCVRFSIGAARAALQSKAPDEALRLVHMTRAVASEPKDRIALLLLQDEGLEMLRRPEQRMEGLAELGALADALADPHLELDVRLRRAAALRLAHDEDAAAEIARHVVELAHERGDESIELAASIELGQDLLQSELGASYTQASNEADLDGAEAAYLCAVELAERMGNDPMLAAACRELGAIALSRVRTWFIEMAQAGELTDITRRVAAGEQLAAILASHPVAPTLVHDTNSYFQRALEIYERLGDRQGAMASIIGIAYLSWAPEIHVTGSAKRIEELRRLMVRMKSFTKESERELADVQLLFGAHVYAMAKGSPDAALAKGEEAYRAARRMGERSIEFAAAGGLARVNAQIDRVEEAKRWLDVASTLVAAAPTPSRVRRLALWRGAVLAGAGDADAMRETLDHAGRIALDQENAAARCEALALLAVESSRLGRLRMDESLLVDAESAAQEVLRQAAALPGHPPWSARASAALANVALARGNGEGAADFGRRAMQELDGAMTEDLHFDIILPAADAIIGGGTTAEALAMRDRLQLMLQLQVQRIADEDVRAAWFRGPTGSELARLAGTLAESKDMVREPETRGLSEDDSRLLRLLVEGRTNREISDEIGETEQSIGMRLAALFGKIGASSRADATAAALLGGLI